MKMRTQSVRCEVEGWTFAGSLCPPVASKALKLFILFEHALKKGLIDGGLRSTLLLSVDRFLEVRDFRFSNLGLGLPSIPRCDDFKISHCAFRKH